MKKKIRELSASAVVRLARSARAALSSPPPALMACSFRLRTNVERRHFVQGPVFLAVHRERTFAIDVDLHDASLVRLSSFLFCRAGTSSSMAISG